MKAPEWYDVMQPREAIIAGVVGFALVWPCGLYAYQSGLFIWGYAPAEWKNVGTAVDVLAFAIPYLVTRAVLRRRTGGRN